MTEILQSLEALICGPRDWYTIEHCKTGKGKPHFSVKVCLWRDGWKHYDGDDTAIQQAIEAAKQQGDFTRGQE